MQINSGLAFVNIGVDVKSDVPGRRRQFGSCAVKKDRASDAQLRCFSRSSRCRSPTIRGGRAASTAEQDKNRLRISITEWLQHLVPMQQIEVDLRQSLFPRRGAIVERALRPTIAARTASKNCSRNFGKFSSRKLTPAAISCPPNFSSVPLHSPRARTIEQPSILRPLPFPAPLSSNPTIIVGR